LPEEECSGEAVPLQSAQADVVRCCSRAPTAVPDAAQKRDVAPELPNAAQGQGGPVEQQAVPNAVQEPSGLPEQDVTVVPEELPDA
jgi:hypothetical protein